MEFGQNGVTLSQEDVAWADSCFSKDPDTDWDSIKYALLQTLDTQNHSSYERENSPEARANMEISSSENTSDEEEQEPNRNGRSNDENTDEFWSRHKREDVFLPTYNENTRDFGVFDPEVDFVFQAFEVEEGLLSSSEDIFKTWDLGIAPREDEEEDAMVQIIKSLAWKDLFDDSLDDLVSGIAGLSLSSKSG
ncbi:hypothetical protein ABFX02_02G017700 [Erythranthe guttata]